MASLIHPQDQYIEQLRIAHAMRNEITTLHESASPGMWFTPLVWWQ